MKCCTLWGGWDSDTAELAAKTDGKRARRHGSQSGTAEVAAGGGELLSGKTCDELAAKAGTKDPVGTFTSVLPFAAALELPEEGGEVPLTTSA
jgi:hypothetical protein